jgi:translation initiation factor IF-3
MTRINERIRVPEVRLIDDEGNQIGVMKTADALTFAQERELDLVEVAPEARPPVARVLDYSKYKYEQAQKQKQARKHQQQITIREIKFRPKIAQHDYDTKKHHVERFLRHKDKVKVTIMFRGREVTHPERGIAILDRLSQEVAEFGVVEQTPTQEGRNMTMMLTPSKAVLSGRTDAPGAPAAAADGVVEAPEGAPAAPGGPAAQTAPASDETRDETAAPVGDDGLGETAAPVGVDGPGETAASAGDDGPDEAAARAPARKRARATEPASGATPAGEPSAEVPTAGAGDEAPNGEVTIAADGKAAPAEKDSKKTAKAAATGAPDSADAPSGTPVS